MSKQICDQSMASQSRVVDQYLDTLLRQATVDAPSPVPQPQSQPAVPVPVLAPPAENDLGAAESVADTPNEPTDETSWALPRWAEPSFQCLDFELGELSLAVPLVGLRRILDGPQPLRRLPGAPGWLLGLCEHVEGRTQVFDLASVIGVRQINDGKTCGEASLLLFGDGEWGCMCSAIGGIRRVEPDQVKWVQEEGGQPWRSGVLCDQLRTLIDPLALSDLLTRRATPE